MDLLQRISQLNPEQKKLLELKLKQQDFDIFKIPISREYRENYKSFPISFEQRPMWFAEQYDPGNTTYDVVGAIRLEGDLNKAALEKSVNEIVKRHEILRTAFILDIDKPAQAILPSLTVRLQLIDCKDLPEAEKKHRLENLRDDRDLRRFDLAGGSLLNTLLFDLGENKYVFLLIMHHLLADLITLKIFFEELARFYNAFSRGNPAAVDLPRLSCQYADYACWQHHWFQESIIGIEARKKQEAFWLDQFRNEAPLLSLPTDYPRPAVKSHEAAQVFFALKGETAANLKQVALKENTTLYVVLLSVLYIFLARLGGQEDIVVGTPISSRKHPALNNIIGIFSRTLLLRNYPQGSKIFKNFSTEVNAATLEAYKNQEFQYDELVGKIPVERDPGRNPLFDVMFNFIALNAGEIEMPGLKIEPFRCKSKSSAFDIELTVEETPGELFFKLSYCTKLFKEETVNRFISYLVKIIETVGKNPAVKISGIDVLPEGEKALILFDFNNTTRNVIRDKSYSRLFEEEAVKNPDKIAAVHCDRHITYNVLNEEAGRIAGILSREGAGPGTIIPLYLKRSIKMLCSIIGVFKRNAAYLPLDIDYPETRVEFILENSRARMAITEKELRTSLPLLEEVLCLDHEKEVEGFDRSHSIIESPIESQPDNLVYLIYTSGTTGNPKGVMIHRLGMINHLYAKINDLAITAVDIIAQTASACFDISVWQFLAALLTGGTTVIIDKEVLLDSLGFLRALQQSRITILESVPSLMLTFLEAAPQEREKTIASLRHLKWVLSTGEPLAPQLVNAWYDHYPHIKLVNAYGPTEASDDITHYIVPVIPPGEITQTTVPIGKPLQNLHIYILDKYLSLCPIGVRGEICVAGIGVGKGYWRDSEKTGAVFIPNPYAGDADNSDYKTLYKTGDLGYSRPDGNIECLGRLDSQVKIRGNRIEPGEIENQLLNHGAVKEAVVIVRTASKENKPGKSDRYLCAYIVSDHEIPAAELQEYLSGKLPRCMVPSYFITVAKIPLTSNGKIDRKALPEPTYENYESSKNHIAPANEIEARLAGIWSELLDIETGAISTDANFFELGGHSLKATLMIAKIHRELRVKLPLAEIFNTPDIKGLSAYIMKAGEDK